MGATSAPVPGQAARPEVHGRQPSGCPCIYVTNGGEGSPSVAVFPASATGNAAPTQVISGGMTQLVAPYSIAVDAGAYIYVADYLGTQTGTGSNFGAVEVYGPGATGNVAPYGYISGNATGLSGPAGVAINPLNGNIYVLNDGNYSITIYSPGSTGNVAPIGKIAGSRTDILGGGYGLAFDASANLYVSNDGNNSVIVYPAGATGNVRPTRTISGPRTKLSSPVNLTVDSAGDIFVANQYPHTGHVFGSITAYAAGANRNAKATQYIKGAMTKLQGPHALALDGSGNLYVTSFYGNWLTAYAPGATGNVAPINIIKGGRTGIEQPEAVTIR
ncbi:MAG TPA: NHL repeat-containing protein [Candidatus Cybelea sp.]|nr:NHL repeat-containing protein [Candidatus Cybelea sp.]